MKIQKDQIYLKIKWKFCMKIRRDQIQYRRSHGTYDLKSNIYGVQKLNLE